METFNQEQSVSERIPFRSVALKLSLLGALALFSLLVVGLDHFTTSTTTAVEETPGEDFFEHITLEAQSAYVLDVTTGKVLFTQEGERQLPLASLTKIMTAIVASDIVPDNAIVTISKEALAIEGDSGLTEGERLRFKNLLDFTLLVSSNDGAGAIASVADAFSKRDGDATNGDFIEKMNTSAHALGLQQSYFLNESGLDANTNVSGGYGSARDMATLFSYAITKKPSLLEATAYSSITVLSEGDLVHDAKNTNPTVSSTPGLIASKTGFTDLAGGNLVIAFDAGINRPIVAVVLGSTIEGRFDDIEKLVKATLKTIAMP